MACNNLWNGGYKYQWVYSKDIVKGAGDIFNSNNKKMTGIFRNKPKHEIDLY